MEASSHRPRTTAAGGVMSEEETGLKRDARTDLLRHLTLRFIWRVFLGRNSTAVGSQGAAG
jgi:hypothetical protein